MLGNRSQTFATGAASAQSAAVASTCRRVYLQCTVAAYARMASNPTAVAGDQLIQPGILYGPYPITPGWKIAAIQVAAAGVFNVIELDS